MSHEEFIHCQYRQEAPIRVRLAGISYCDGKYCISRQKSSVAVAEYVIRGRGTVIIDGVPCYPRAGDVYLLAEGTRHEYFADAEDPWVKIWFNVQGPLLPSLLDMYGLRDVHHVPDLDVEALFRQAHHDCTEDTARSSEIVAIMFHQLVVRIAAELKRRGQTEVKESRVLYEYLERCVGETPTLDQMARLLGRSPSQAVRVFKRDWGMTPYQFLLDRKLQKARALLAASTYGVKEIAAQLGFHDQYHFSNLFKQKIGLAPTHYRLASQQGAPSTNLSPPELARRSIGPATL